MAEDERHRTLMLAAIERDAEGQRALVKGSARAAQDAFRAAAEIYRESWEIAPPRSYGRLIGMLKSAVLGGGGAEYRDYVERAIPDGEVTSAPAAYARALSALLAGDDCSAVRWAEAMRSTSESAGRTSSRGGPFERTAAAIAALATADEPAYRAAVAAIVRDFEQRQDHLTGVAIADTALMLEQLAARRGLRAGVTSPLMPAAS